MRPEEVPAEPVERAAIFGFDLMAEGGRDAGRWADLPDDDISKDYHRVLARYHLAAVLPEIQAQALRDAADDVSAAPHWPDEDRYTMGWEDAIGAVRKRAARLTATEGVPVPAGEAHAPSGGSGASGGSTGGVIRNWRDLGTELDPREHIISLNPKEPT